MSTLPSFLKNLASPASIKPVWGVLKNVPQGGKIMGSLAGRMAPYTATIHPEILALDDGYARVRMADKRRVRNHLDCVHAIALMNLGEMTTGIAMLYSLPQGMRGIISNLSMEYLKKARGTITAECSVANLPAAGERRNLELTADLKNDASELVARAHARWLVGPA